MYPRAPRPVLDSTRFGRTPASFLLGLAACCLIAIIALAAVVVQRGPAPALVGLLLALLPVPLLVALILCLDRLEPEPRALLAAIFGAGAGIAALTALFGRVLHTGVITAPELRPHVSVTAVVPAGQAIDGAFVAETLSGLVLLALLASRRTEIDGVEDGVVYGSMLGLGYALVANVYAYALAWNAGAGAIAEEFASRGIFAPVFQALFASLIGLGVAYAAARPAARGRWPAIVAGWGAAVALDALWNHAAGADGPWLAASYLILVAMLIAAVIAVIAGRRRLIRMIRGVLPDFADPEVVTGQDIRMLASPRLRRLGRQWARLNHGVAGQRAMAQYQLAATELAMACRRLHLGQTTQDAYVRHRDDSLSLMRAAAALLREREQLQPPPWTAPDAPSVFVAGEPGPFWPAGPSWPSGPR
ncbi:MAG TPA: PrsW family glutamic-type intramembrane protease [Trebonia sp.]